jgi:P27 family predicted phage terminase small subunit
MGSPGPKPVPTKLRLLRGETRPSRINRNEPQPAVGDPRYPGMLSREAKAEWRRLIKALPAGLLTPADRQVMSVAAQAWYRWYLATVAVNETGILIEGERGLVKNPAIQVARDAEQTLRQCWAELGLSPAARQRINMPGPEGEDPLGGIFS